MVNFARVNLLFTFDSDRRILYIFQELHGSKISNEKLGDTKPTWKLSKDKLTYEKTYSENQEYYKIYIKYKNREDILKALHANEE